MKVIIAGSRTISNWAAVRDFLDATFPDPSVITEVVSGMCGYWKKGVLYGVDRLGERWAAERDIRVKRFPADWNFHGAQAGPLRNIEMAKYASGYKETEDYGISRTPGALALVWDGASPGSGHMLRTARRNGLRIFEKILENLHAHS